jgi:hypothetical protein
MHFDATADEVFSDVDLGVCFCVVHCPLLHIEVIVVHAPLMHFDVSVYWLLLDWASNFWYRTGIAIPRAVTVDTIISIAIKLPENLSIEYTLKRV